MNICSRNECARVASSRGLCDAHYAEARRAGTLPHHANDDRPPDAVDDQSSWIANALWWDQITELNELPPSPEVYQRRKALREAERQRLLDNPDQCEEPPRHRYPGTAGVQRPPMEV